MAVRVVTDSACDLPPELCVQLGIEVVPLTIRFGDEELVDRVELTTEQFWERMATTPVMPETAAPPVGAFEETFRRLADEGADAIVCIDLSSRLSATMQSAQVAAKALEGRCPVSIVDSMTASMGIGMLAMHAARRAAEGTDLETITDELEDRRRRLKTYAALDTLEYLRRGGRIGGAQALLGSVLSIKPIIAIEDGAVAPAGKVRTRSKALRFLVDQLKEGRVETLCVLHAQAPDLDEFLQMLEPIAPDEITVGTIGPVVGVHGGPGIIGITWIEREA